MFRPSVVPSFLALALALVLAPLGAFAQSADENSAVVQFAPGGPAGHGFNLARVRVYYRAQAMELTRDLMVRVRLAPEGVESVSSEYWYQGRQFAVPPLGNGQRDSVDLSGRVVSGGTVLKAFRLSINNGGYASNLDINLGSLKQHLRPATEQNPYPEDWVRHFLQTIVIVLDQPPPVTTWAADAECQRQLREAEQKERQAREQKEREEREAKAAREKQEREAQAARAQQERERQQREAQAAREQQQREAEQQRASAGTSGSSSATSSGATTREQQQAEAQARYVEQQRQQQLAQERREQEAREARQRDEEHARAVAEHQRYMAEEERRRQQQLEEDTKKLAETAAPLVAEGLNALDEAIDTINEGQAHFNELSLGCQLATSTFAAVTPGCALHYRTGALIYFVLGGGWSSAPPLAAEVYRDDTRVGVTQAALSGFSVELGVGLALPLNDDLRLVAEIAPFAAYDTLAPVSGYSTSEEDILLAGLGVSGGAWYRLPGTVYRVGLMYRYQGVGLGFMADEGKADVISDDLRSSGSTLTSWELKKSFEDSGWYSSLGLSFAFPL